MVSKNIIVITGGAGFIGTNLIKLFLTKTNYKIISIDNYSSGTKKNHIKNSRVKYLKGNTTNIDNLIKNSKKIKCLMIKCLRSSKQVFFHRGPLQIKPSPLLVRFWCLS